MISPGIAMRRRVAAKTIIIEVEMLGCVVGLIPLLSIFKGPGSHLKLPLQHRNQRQVIEKVLRHSLEIVRNNFLWVGYKLLLFLSIDKDAA